MTPDLPRDTIFALATAPAKSGVAVIRVSGGQATAALHALTGKTKLAPNRASLCSLRHPQSKAIIDQALVLFFQGPKSFTGEDVVEFHTHGSLAIYQELLAALSQINGLRPAEPGEFTRRAFLNGKMDLIEAEGLADLIEAETPKQKDQALRQMHGDLSRYYTQLRTQIITVLAHMEAYIDFPDEEIPQSVFDNLTEEVNAAIATIDQALSDHQAGERLRSGMRVVILGAPNAGKSSLLNRLAKRDAAIVSQRAGTTRDVIEVHLHIAGYPVILTDTAGLRESGDDIEEEGIRRALLQAEDADIRLIVFDGSLLPALDASTQALMDERSLVIINKSDVMPKASLPSGALVISTKSGEGIDALLAAIEAQIIKRFSGHAPVITRHRHRALLQEALTHLKRFDAKAPLELSCEELRISAQAVDKITGKISVDDVLDVIFKQFCIGK
ncbi:MAG: tRNA uridine-5-carboxymethylaminomethyl(34) synthesis GTPase MnmE [Rickettsiales bacterium]|nr:tRNA uridine-5-carboxymethylaminomethyl(34) synthesis GTPase MnmE [Rickettsiales bacterium]